MGRERKSNPRKMRPLFFVLCEGETEEVYINFLKQRYRLPIKIVAKITGSSLYSHKIEQYKKEIISEPSECKTFFMYDGDIPEVLDSLKNIDGIMLISKPCIEVWFISHYKKVAETDISSDECIKQLYKITGWEQYKKAVLTSSQQDGLWENRMKAVSNMKSKTEENKTYSTIYKLIEILEDEKKK